MRLLYFVFLFSLAPSVALGGEEINSAGRLFSKMKFDRALESVERVLKSPDNEPEDLVEAYCLQGLCLAAIGEPGRATDAFKKLLAIDPSFKSTVKWSPEISPKLIVPFHRAVESSRNIGSIALEHRPPEPAKKLGGLRLDVKLLSDPLKMVRAIRFRFRKGGSLEEHRVVQRVEGPGPVPVMLPAGFDAREICYCFEALNEHGGVLSRSGSMREPFRLQAKSSDSLPSTITATMIPSRSSDADEAASGLDEPTKKYTDSRRWYETWWFWTAVGVVAAGAATATALSLTGSEPGGPVDYRVGFGVK